MALDWVEDKSKVTMATVLEMCNRGENKNDVGFLYVISNVLRAKTLAKNSIHKDSKLFFKQVVADYCIFFCLDLALDQSWAISF